MAQSLVRNVSAQENNVNQDDIRDEYECTICLNWLREPVLTSCGHRFCQACITSWLKKDESRCPIDNKLLDSDRDIFVDNFTKRQIDQIVKPCENATAGCSRVFAVASELETHLQICEFRANGGGGESGGASGGGLRMDCTFAYCGCLWRGAGKEELDEHLREDLNQHLEMLVTTCRDGQNLSGMENHRLWDAPAKRTTNGGGGGGNGANASDASVANHEQMDLIRGMYERIVVLEQQNREQVLKVDKLTEELARLSHLDSVRSCDGVLVWRLTQFHSKLDSMQNNPNVLLYSQEALTSAHGYKFCARINLSPKSPGFLGLHIHLMQSENDYHLDWPFKGRIKILMIHPRGLFESQSDTIMSKPEVLAFHRPEQRVSPRGFGFVEYALVDDIIRKGFVDRDSVTFKIQVNLV